MSALRRSLAAVIGLLATLTAFALLATMSSAQVSRPDRSPGTSELNRFSRSGDVTVGANVDLCNIQSRLQQLPRAVRQQMIKDSACS